METTPHTKTNNTLVFLLCASIPFLNVETLTLVRHLSVFVLPGIHRKGKINQLAMIHHRSVLSVSNRQWNKSSVDDML